jgi:hypothetical protein
MTSYLSCALFLILYMQGNSPYARCTNRMLEVKIAFTLCYIQREINNKNVSNQ